MEQIKAPNKYNNIHLPKVFLAGSIEMGKAINWQQQLADELSVYPIVLLNPRRDNWDSSWKQDILHPQFFEQVTWELDAAKDADLVVIFFDPNTQAPITLLELGILAESKARDVVVCCPNGYYRKGNVDIVCDRYNIRQVESLYDLAEYVKLFFKLEERKKQLSNPEIYHGNWTDIEDMCRDFSISKSDLKGFRVMYAVYETPGYEGTAWVLLKKGNEYYEVNASHCSCYGLENQWSPEETTLKTLGQRGFYGSTDIQAYIKELQERNHVTG